MTTQDHIEKSALKLAASRERAAKQELRHGLAIARLKLSQDRMAERRERLLGNLLVRGAADDAELSQALIRLVEKIKEGTNASLLAGWAVPQPTARTMTSVAQPTLALSPTQTRSEVRS